MAYPLWGRYVLPFAFRSASPIGAVQGATHRLRVECQYYKTKVHVEAITYKSLLKKANGKGKIYI